MHTSKSPTKYIFVTGGVISGLGKGISTASIAQILKDFGYKVSVVKVDMYLNLDAGTINPLEHGEVFVTEDGVESDQDLGNYERFMNQDMKRHNYMTMGQVYYEVITRERKLEYDGEDVEGHIHIPKEIIRRINETAKLDDADIILVEVGGTVGEYQNVMFFEAIRRLKQQKYNDVALVHLVYLIKPKFLGELKSKPAQSSIYELYRLGLQPNFVICRSDQEIDEKKKELIAFNSGISKENIISAPDVETIYSIPLLFQKQKFGQKLLTQLGLPVVKKPTNDWAGFVKKAKHATGTTNIAITGKYFNIGDASVLEDAYICVIEALKHAAWEIGTNVNIQWFNVERFENPKEAAKIKKELSSFDGIVVPQGWGSRAVEGKIKTVNYARTHKTPYLGLCFGLQMAIIEYSRNVLGLKNANSHEVNPGTPHPVIHLMPEQLKHIANKEYGGTIRLGSWPCLLNKHTQLETLYKKYWPKKDVERNIINERHRHRYEVNNAYRNQLEEAGMVISGTSLDGLLVEAIELPNDKHPFFLATQYHPEYKSRPLKPHPVFIGFVEASRKYGIMHK